MVVVELKRAFLEAGRPPRAAQVAAARYGAAFVALSEDVLRDEDVKYYEVRAVRGRGPLSGDEERALASELEKIQGVDSAIADRPSAHASRDMLAGGRMLRAMNMGRKR